MYPVTVVTVVYPPPGRCWPTTSGSSSSRGSRCRWVHTHAHHTHTHTHTTHTPVGILTVQEYLQYYVEDAIPSPYMLFGSVSHAMPNVPMLDPVVVVVSVMLGIHSTFPASPHRAPCVVVCREEVASTSQKAVGPWPHHHHHHHYYRHHPTVRGTHGKVVWGCYVVMLCSGVDPLHPHADGGHGQLPAVGYAA